MQQFFINEIAAANNDLPVLLEGDFITLFSVLS